MPPALLALWNGVDPARADEYHLWHTREHVPERLTIPGIRHALRFVDGEGPLPSCLTLYQLDSPDVLTSPPYRALLENPTPWSRAMRPALRDFLRIPCHPVTHAGTGLAPPGTAGALLATTLPPGMEIPAETLRAAIAIPAITGALFAPADSAAPPVPFSVPGIPPNIPRAAVLLLAGYSRPALLAAIPTLQPLFPDRTWTAYTLACTLGRDDLPALAPIQRP